MYHLLHLTEMPYFKSNIQFMLIDITQIDITQRENRSKKTLNVEETEGIDILVIPWRCVSCKKSTADSRQKSLHDFQFHFNYTWELNFFIPFIFNSNITAKPQDLGKCENSHSTVLSYGFWLEATSDAVPRQ